MPGSRPSMEEIREDFDRIALLDDGGWNHNDHYHKFLLRQLPSPCGDVLEVGCGTGGLARLLAERARHVLALDLSPEMVRRAGERAVGAANLEFEVADVNRWRFPAGRFDAVVSVATLHHLPLGATLSRMASSLRPGGTLAVLDIYERRWTIDLALDLVAVPASYAWRLARRGTLREGPEEARRAWAGHAAHDTFLTFSEVRRVARETLPGVIVRRHLLWRYSLVWRKPTA